MMYRKKTIYIAGKITGDKNYKQKFKEAQERYEKQGYHVLNPTIMPPGKTNSEYMRVCFALIDMADEVVFLPSWKYSKGAQLELAYCKYTGKKYKFESQGGEKKRVGQAKDKKVGGIMILKRTKTEKKIKNDDTAAIRPTTQGPEEALAGTYEEDQEVTFDEVSDKDI